jgi:hypothetical protein
MDKTYLIDCSSQLGAARTSDSAGLTAAVSAAFDVRTPKLWPVAAVPTAIAGAVMASAGQFGHVGSTAFVVTPPVHANAMVAGLGIDANANAAADRPPRGAPS